MSARPADVLLHPIALVASGLYIANDWWLKAAYPGVVSGKLSDVAGMVVLPLTLLAVAELVSGRVLGRRALALAVGVTIVGFSLVEVWGPAEQAWCWTWGSMQWPFRAAASLATGHPLPPVRPVVAWSDPSDLLTVPFAALAWLAGRRRYRSETSTRSSSRSTPPSTPSSPKLTIANAAPSGPGDR